MLIFGAIMSVSLTACQSTIIILNGPSASGKSTTQKAVQMVLDELYLCVGMDALFAHALTYSKMHTRSNGQIICRPYQVEVEGKPAMKLEIGPAGKRVMRGVHQALAAYADAGNNIIVDYILYQQEWLPDLIRVFKNHRVYFIGIKIPLSLLEERERIRNRSLVSHGRSHYYEVHKGCLYDFKVNTGSKIPAKCAEAIKRYIACNPKPQAFKTLAKQFGIEIKQ